MPRLKPKAEIANNPYNSIKRGEDFRHECNDCAVQAVAVVCRVPYEEAHAACKRVGRKDGDGMGVMQINRVVESFGFKVEPVMTWDMISQYPGVHKNLKNVTTHHPHRFNDVWANGRTYLFYTKRHVAAVVNGDNGDWCRRQSLRANLIYEVTSLDAPKSESKGHYHSKYKVKRKMAVKRGNKIIEEGWMVIEDVPKGEFVKRKSEAVPTYTRGEYCRYEKKYQLDDYGDISRCIYAKKGTLVWVGFTF